ncbi:apoptosis-stimulating of p53 protein 2-like [Manacus vitellinus]|uniref:apoptosis-stimulating of p53 protein 2-like n=1 Tax=Manacus vitellinus TaxID=328815 RepID=UPI00115F337F|nr:apoptosis-stimulating of p53 protein 2-like [Manacus vitellinus]
MAEKHSALSLLLIETLSSPAASASWGPQYHDHLPSSGSMVAHAKPSPSAPDWSSSNADNHIGQESASTSGILREKLFYETKRRKVHAFWMFDSMGQSAGLSTLRKKQSSKDLLREAQSQSSAPSASPVLPSPSPVPSVPSQFFPTTPSPSPVPLVAPSASNSLVVSPVPSQSFPSALCSFSLCIPFPSQSPCSPSQLPPQFPQS